MGRVATEFLNLLSSTACDVCGKHNRKGRCEKTRDCALETETAVYSLKQQQQQQQQRQIH